MASVYVYSKYAIDACIVDIIGDCDECGRPAEMAWTRRDEVVFRWCGVCLESGNVGLKRPGSSEG